VVHLLEHTHNTLQGLYIELEVPNLLLQILDVLKVHKPLSIPVILDVLKVHQPVSSESAAGGHLAQPVTVVSPPGDQQWSARPLQNHCAARCRD
jgi:hypothetical protein